jgi:hypothetical protein
MKVLDIIKSSLRLIGVVSSDEDVSAADAQSALMIYNMMLDQWRNEKLMVYCMRSDRFNLGVGVSSYTIGPGGDFNTVRPLKVEKATIHYGNLDFELEIIPFDRYAELIYKAIASTYPTKLWYNPTYPLGTITLYPVPNAIDLGINIYQRIAAASATSITDDVLYPEGYLQALRYNLAVELAPEYGAPVSALIGSQAAKSKSLLKTTNQEDVLMECDSVTGRGYKRYTNANNFFSIYAGA